MNNYSSVVKEKVLKAINSFDMLIGVQEVVLGFSGGADSVCLLHILNSLKNVYGYSLKAIHINHGIRGEEADCDERFAEEFCGRYNIPFVSVKVDCVSEAKKNKESVEECGRRIRYEIFNNNIGENGVIATAHNANDNAETVIFNITRGTSVKGLCGIPFVRKNIIRPLLYCSRNEIEEYCSENDLDFVIDSTNSDVEYTRNKIRHQILPVIEQINPSFVDSFSSLSENAHDVCSFLNSNVNTLLEQTRMSDYCYDRELLLKADKAVVCQLISSEFTGFCGLLLDNKKIKSVYDLLISCGRLQLYGDNFVEVKKDYLRFFKFNSNFNSETVDVLQIPFKAEFLNYIISLEKISDNSKIVNQFDDKNMIDYNSISGELVLRTRKSGDKFTFVKRNVTKSLKKLFTEENIPVEARNTIPVISDDLGVVWVYGFGVTKRCCADKYSDNIILVRGKNNDR